MWFRSFRLYLFITSSLFVIIKCDQSILTSIDSPINPDFLIKNCTFAETCRGSINSSAIHYYSVQYPFTPDTSIHVTTNMTFKASQDSPILVVVRQVHGIASWTLPYAFSNGMIYSSVSRILCQHNEVNRSHTHFTTIFIEISTSNVELIDYSIQIGNITEYVLRPEIQEDIKRDFTISPAMPIYYRVIFPIDVDNLFIEVTSKDDLCAVVSVQSYNCPVYDVGEIGVRQGHYQTMTTSSSFNVYSTEFKRRNEFLLVFLVKPTDADCLDYNEQAEITPAGLIDVQRTKNATVRITAPTRFNHLYTTIFLTLLVFGLMYVIAFVIMVKYEDIYENFTLEVIPLLDERREFELTENPFATPFTQTLDEDEDNGLIQTLGEDNGLIQTSEGEVNVIGTCPNDYARQSSNVEVISTSTCGFVTVSALCVKDYEHLKQKFRIYPTTMATIAIFYSLPVIQLVLQYQMNIDSVGNEDICFFNFLCTRELFNLTAFNNLFSNIGYCVLGVLFLMIVYRRDNAYTRFLKNNVESGKEFGIPQHFGLFYAMAIGLIMEGVMSACYHVCPSRQNFQFDTSFMFIIGVLNLIKIYQTRHADINPNSARTFSFLAIIIFITVVGVYYDQLWFWILYAIIHIIIFLTFTAKIYYMGRLKISFRIHVHLYRLMKENGFFSRPRYVNRVVILLFANCINIAFALYGAIFQPESFPNHLLFVFLGNLALYLIYYIIMKLIHRERFTRATKVFLFLAMIFWSSSLYFFYVEVKSYEVSAAVSRTYNRQCLVLDTYDHHDIWHLLSSIALFFSFLSILTIDDGVRNKRRKELAAF